MSDFECDTISNERSPLKHRSNNDSSLKDFKNSETEANSDLNDHTKEQTASEDDILDDQQNKNKNTQLIKMYLIELVCIIA